ncbi:MAG: energy-coupling factor ABC transporter permease [Candidatus Bathyarchaeia archaeon]
MHIMDGILSPLWVAIWFIVAAPFLAVGLVKIARKRRENPAYMSLLALMGATVFILSVWHIPVPVTGSCSHPCGVALSAIIVGPFESVVLAFIALFFQMFLAHGGITTLGANTVSMGIVGGFLGYGVYLALRRLGVQLWISAGVAGFIGDLATYVTTAGQLALSLHPQEVIRYWGFFSMGFLPTQVPVAIIEFAVTAAIVRYIAISHPEVLGGMKKIG